VLSAIREILRNHPMGSNDLRIICTDSWDLANINDDDVGDFLDGASFVVVPEVPGGPDGRIYSDGRSLDGHFRSLNPLTSPSPWTKEVWRDYFKCDPVTNVTCSNLRLDPDFFHLDSKLEFVVETVFLFSEAFER